MTRELKFRAWDKLSGRYYLDVLLEDGGAIKATEREGQPSWPRDLVWEQFTGLKDKSGREIYEGDILRHEFYVKPEFSSEYSGKQVDDFQVKIPEFFKLIGDLEQHQPPQENGTSPSEFMEIIGNVHENPQLLNK